MVATPSKFGDLTVHIFVKCNDSSVRHGYQLSLAGHEQNVSLHSRWEPNGVVGLQIQRETQQMRTAFQVQSKKGLL